MKNSILLALLLLSFIYGFTQNHYKYDNIKINSPHLFYENKRQEQEIVLSLIDAYFSKNLSFQEKYSFWKRSNNQLYLEDIDLYQIEKYAQGGDYTPTILSMLYIDEKYQIRIRSNARKILNNLF